MTTLKTAVVLLAHGFEETEAITVIDILRRAQVVVTTVAVDAADRHVVGAHAITIVADAVLNDVAAVVFDALVLPGGMPGAETLRTHAGVVAMIQRHRTAPLVAAICAAPMALGEAGVLVGKNATSYPGFESYLRGATYSEAAVVVDGNTITSRALGTALPFALACVRRLCGDAVAEHITTQVLAKTTEA